jgi:hypothetical protein
MIPQKFASALFLTYAWAMPKIFISYRRADSGKTTERIHDRLVAAFGEDVPVQ